MEELIDTSADLGVENIVMGMPHRGRLSVLTNVVILTHCWPRWRFTKASTSLHTRLYFSYMKVRKPLESVFCEFKKEVLLLPISGLSILVAYHLDFS